MSFTLMLEENNDQFGAKQRNYADDERVSLSSVLRRLDKKFEDMMVEVHHVFGPKLVEMEGRIMRLELAVDKLLTSLGSDAEHNALNPRQKCLKLQFTNKVYSPIWTGDEIKGEGGEDIKVVLVDEAGKVVDWGPESSAEVKIAAFRGDDDNEGETGEIESLADGIARKRKTKKSILMGDVQLKLNEGIGTLTNIKFRSSSSHTSGDFKLGAQVVDQFDGIAVEGAKTVSFRVKDYRGKYNEKHHPPFLFDEIWRLDNIGRGGSVHDRLKNQGFNTVENFLIQLLKDSDELKEVVGLPQKKWDATVKHARTCQPDGKVYCSISSEENKGIVFNVVGKVFGLIVESRYLPLDELSYEYKADASKLELAAFLHKGELVSFDDEASLIQQFSQPIKALHPPNCSRSQSTIDHEDEVSEIVESHQANLYTSFRHDPSFSYISEGTNMMQEDFHSFIDPLLVIDENDDQHQQLLESLWDFDNQQTASIADMLLEPPVVSDYEVKKKLLIFFTVTKWFLNFEKNAASGGNDHQKRRRIS